MKRVKGQILLLVLFFAGLVTLILAVLAVTDGVGYDVNVKQISHTLSMERKEGPQHEVSHGHANYSIDLDIYFNPFLYPVSHAIGDGQVSGNFTRLYFVGRAPWVAQRIWLPSDSEVGEDIAGEIMSAETRNNLPYFLIIGSVTGVVATRIIQVVAGEPVEPE